MTIKEVNALRRQVRADIAHCKAHGLNEWVASCEARLWSLDKILRRKLAELGARNDLLLAEADDPAIVDGSSPPPNPQEQNPWLRNPNRN